MAPIVQDITVIILSFNEELHIERCISRIRDRATRVVVIDSGSTDRTVEIAQSAGAEVFANPFVNQAQQFGWALDNVKIESDWILRLDCDEYLDADALAWIDGLDALDAGVAGVEFRLKVIFKGKFLRFGGYYATDLIRLWRTGKGRIEARWMDERTVVDGHIVKARGHLVDENLNSIGWWTEKHNRYSSRHMVEMLTLRHFPERYESVGSEKFSHRARLKRFVRTRIYPRFPLFVRPFIYWVIHYFLLLGFLDGLRGMIWHFLHGYWYFMLIDAKILEADRVLARQGEAGLIAHLRSVHGISLDRLGDR